MKEIKTHSISDGLRLLADEYDKMDAEQPPSLTVCRGDGDVTHIELIDQQDDDDDVDVCLSVYNVDKCRDALLSEFNGIVSFENHQGKEWSLNGLCHRINGPAMENSDGTKVWATYGRIHRDDGPAIEGADGTKHWYINDVQIQTIDEYMEYTDLTDEDKVMFKLKWGG